MTSQNLITNKITSALISLKKLPENEYASDESIKQLQTIDSSFYDNTQQLRHDIAETLLQHDFPDLAVKFTKYFSRIGLFEGEIWPCCFYLLRSIWNFTDVNSELAMRCSCLLPFLLGVLSDDSLQPDTESEDEKLIKITLNILNNIAHHPETKSKFQKLKASQILKSLSKVRNEHLRVLVYLVLAQVVTETEFSQLNDTARVIENVYFYLKESIRSDEHRYKGISTAEYLDSMAKMAVTQENKLKLIKCGVIDVLRLVLNDTTTSNKVVNVNEKLHALTCIWNLCFDEKARQILKADKALLRLVENVGKDDSASEIEQRVSGILFTLNDLAVSPENSVKSGISKIIGHEKSHVMISYNWGSKDICLKLNQELQSRGYAVWIDVEQIYGSSLASMAEAVENSSVFLMCVSEKYYMSPNCRLEAEYATRLRKPIVPLLMQADYMPTGWLGIIMGDKIYYKFSSMPERTFLDSLESMLKEVKRYVRAVSSGTKSVDSKSRDVAAENWLNSDVKNWIESLNLSSWILASSIFDGIDGSQLKELSLLKSRAPEVFYNILKQEFRGDIPIREPRLSDLLKFSCELTKLFA